MGWVLRSERHQWMVVRASVTVCLGQCLREPPCPSTHQVVLRMQLEHRLRAGVQHPLVAEAVGGPRHKRRGMDGQGLCGRGRE